MAKPFRSAGRSRSSHPSQFRPRDWARVEDVVAAPNHRNGDLGVESHGD